MENVRRQTISDQATWLAQASSEDFDEPWPSLEAAQEAFDEQLAADDVSVLVSAGPRTTTRDGADMSAVSGGVQLQMLGRRMTALGAAGNLGADSSLSTAEFGRSKTLRGQLTAGIRIAAKPAIVAVRAAARDQLPHKGGLNELVAKAPARVATRTTGARVGVRITDRGSGVRGTNRGVIRHPVFGSNVWVEQTLRTSGWFDDTLLRMQPEIAAKVVAAMEIVAAEATRRLV